MKLLAPGLLLLLALLPCCVLVRSESQGSNPGSAASNGTNHTTTAAPVKPTANITTTHQTDIKNTTLLPSVPSNTTTVSPVTSTTSTTIATSTTVKTNATKTSPTSFTSANVTSAASKAPPSNTTAETATPRAPSNLPRTSGFDVGSFIGGIVLTLGLLIIGYIGCRTYHAKRGVQYRTIDEHDAII